MNVTERRLQGWYPDETSGGTQFWDGSRWTGDFRPVRKSFAAASASRCWAWALLIFGSLTVVSSPTQFGQTERNTSMSPLTYLFVALVVGIALIALGIYLWRGQGPSTKAVLARLEAEARENAPTQPNVAAAAGPVININIAHSSADHHAAAQVQAISHPDTAQALQNLHNLLYTRALTDEEFQAAKDKLLGNT